MFRIGLKELWARKRRLAGTFLAVLLGASFLCGTLVLGDTLEANFDGLFTDANGGTDAIIRSRGLIEASAEGPTNRVRGSVDPRWPTRSAVSMGSRRPSRRSRGTDN